jgi:RimJ/RimL family protein N-acetyltransferase
MIDIPTLMTERLVLRPMVEADFPAYREMMGSPRSACMGGPFDDARAWGMFCHDIACWTLFGHGALMIDVTATGQCVGQVGINHGPLFPEKELGWLLYEGFEGQGYVTEAAVALRDWAFAELKLESFVSYFDPANHRSIAVAKRLGAVRDELAPRQDPEDVVYRHLPPGRAA